MGTHMNLEQKCVEEIEVLHKCFDDWFNGRALKTQEGFDRIRSVLSENFVILMPDGRKMELNPLLQGLFTAHGGRRGIRIWIRNVKLIVQDRELVVVEYEEWQEEENLITSRYSTVIFRHNKEMPNSLEWLRVHETFFEEPNN